MNICQIYFGVAGTKHLGGKLKSNFVSEPDTVYIVDSDVNIPSSKEFKLSPGNILLVLRSIYTDQK